MKVLIIVVMLRLCGLSASGLAWASSQSANDWLSAKFRFPPSTELSSSFALFVTFRASDHNTWKLEKQCVAVHLEKSGYTAAHCAPGENESAALLYLVGDKIKVTELSPAQRTRIAGRDILELHLAAAANKEWPALVGTRYPFQTKESVSALITELCGFDVDDQFWVNFSCKEFQARYPVGHPIFVSNAEQFLKSFPIPQTANSDDDEKALAIQISGDFALATGESGKLLVRVENNKYFPMGLLSTFFPSREELRKRIFGWAKSHRVKLSPDSEFFFQNSQGLISATDRGKLNSLYGVVQALPPANEK